ncbi:hypothetical protein H1R20_g4330, partial [Candolleomyces eurysporus]
MLPQTIVDSEQPLPVIELASSSNGRVSGKSWKLEKSATVRSQLPEGVKTKRWEDRMEKTKKQQAIKKLQTELKDEKQADFQRHVSQLHCCFLDLIRLSLHVTRRRQITLERKKAAEEKRRIEEAKATMGARKAARLRKRAGRSKTVNH